MKEARSRIDPRSLQEVLNAESSPEWATLAGQNQYFTHEWLCKELAGRLLFKSPSSIIDPQAGEGNTVRYGIGWVPYKFGIEIDNRTTNMIAGVQWITANCVEVFEVMDDLFPDARFHTFNANPPFAKRWKLPGGAVIDSTEYTWNQAIKRGCQGYFIANCKTIERLGIDKHPFVTHYQRYENVWKNCEVVIGAVVWSNPDAKPTNGHELIAIWDKVREVVMEEKKNVPAFNIWLGTNGKLGTYLSTRATLKKKITREEILRLTTVNGVHPLTLTTERETRKLLTHLVECGFYTIEPKALKAIKDALSQVEALACPIMPVTDFETVAYAEEEDHLECNRDWTHGMRFTKGKRYELTTATYGFTESFKRSKAHCDEETGVIVSVPHECTLSGQDRYIKITDDDLTPVYFMDRPPKDRANCHPESLLWEIFERPKVKTVAEAVPTVIEKNNAILNTCEMLGGFDYYPGQKQYLARVAAKDSALIAASTGCGKSLMAITLMAMKAPTRALLIAPQGTMRSSKCDTDDDEDGEEQVEMGASQWVTELRKFAPYFQIFELFSLSDYERILSLNNGELPPGIFVTYYSAAFQNGARETCPPSWTDVKFIDYLKANEFVGDDAKLPVVPEGSGRPESHWAATIGEEHGGIRCIAQPCLATLIGSKFDMVILDEAHIMQNLESNTTQMFIRLQPKYRYALTATPIPNVISNLFSLMGWICVPNWFRGDLRNAAFPYAREELARFDSTFRSTERDHTQEAMNKGANKDWKGKCEKQSPVISSPARLLKILKPSMAFISKEQCNPDYKPPTLVDVRVPFGDEQARLYAHFLNRCNVPGKHPLIRARRQIAYLRAICADPAGFEHGGPKVHSNMNPKTLSILKVIGQIMAEGEQVVLIFARVGQTSTMQRLLCDAGLSIARIDSTIQAEQHAYQANLFKSGRARALLMGIKCASSYSFTNCPCEIVGSLEYSNGSLEQAKGRVDRVNSTKPRKIFCILNATSIEEVMFDTVATKGDAATICLHGKRIPRDFKPVDMSEVLATASGAFSASMVRSESSCETEWPALREAIRKNAK